MSFYSKFPQEIKLEGEIIEIDTAIFRYPFRIRVDGDKAIIMDLHGPDYSGESRYCWVNREGGIINKVGSIPSTNRDALQHARPALAQAWRSFVDYNPHNDILATATQLGEVIEVRNLIDSTCVIKIGEHGEM